MRNIVRKIAKYFGIMKQEELEEKVEKEMVVEVKIWKQNQQMDNEGKEDLWEVIRNSEDEEDKDWEFEIIKMSEEDIVTCERLRQKKIEIVPGLIDNESEEEKSQEIKLKINLDENKQVKQEVYFLEEKEEVGGDTSDVEL